MYRTISLNKTGGYVARPKFELNDLGLNDGIVDGKIMDISSNINETARINVVTQVAAITRGKSKSNNPVKRYQKLLKEAAVNPTITAHKKQLISDTTMSRNFLPLDEQESLSLVVNKDKNASRVLEFIPVRLKYKMDGNSVILELRNTTVAFSLEKFNNEIGRFSYLHLGYIYTNLRALINAGIKYNNIPYNLPDETKYFRIIKLHAPHFVFDQIYTHTVLSKVAVSDRVVEDNDYGLKFFLPDDIMERVMKKPHDAIKRYAKFSVNMNDEEYDIQEVIEIFITRMSTDEVINYLKDLGYKREIYNRWSYGLKYKTWFMAGWINDPMSWPHLLLEREAYPEVYKSWVQEDTAALAKGLSRLIKFNVTKNN